MIWNALYVLMQLVFVPLGLVVFIAILVWICKVIAQGGVR